MGTIETFEDLVKIEPRLGVLLSQIKKEKRVEQWEECWFQRWYGNGDRSGYKQKMMKLVGWFSEKDNPKLKTISAYELAYLTLCDSLPSCDTCMCDTCPDSQNYNTDNES